MERKCLNCGEWNENEDFCKNCNNPLSVNEINAKRKEVYQEKERLRQPTKLDIWLEKLSKHPNPFVKVVYYIFYSIWSILMALIAGVLYMVAGTPG